MSKTIISYVIILQTETHNLKHAHCRILLTKHNYIAKCKPKHFPQIDHAVTVIEKKCNYNSLGSKLMRVFFSVSTSFAVSRS